MTYEEIKNALLTTGSVAIESDHARRIVLNDPLARRLARVLFDRLRSSGVSSLSNNQEFFEALEVVFAESGDDVEQTTEAGDEARETVADLDRRSWRLKKVEARGFGGLNAVSGDNFEFDVAGRDFCIEGQNGSGKTSLSNAVLFAMTGRIHRDQYGIWDDPARLESVVSDDGTKTRRLAPDCGISRRVGDGSPTRRCLGNADIWERDRRRGNPCEAPPLW